MTGLLALLLLALGAAVLHLWRRMRRLEVEVAALARRVDAGVRATSDEAPPRPAPATAAPLTAAQPRVPADRSAAIGARVPDAPARSRPRVTLPSLEELVGGRLLIWVGAAALVVAAFFLVRYSIESGLIGPAARALLAAAFAGLLIAASEAARRLPATADDPRIAQALAGAGIASAYGTLYLAAAVYDLIGALPAFVLMLGVTGAGLALALRHGPPTAAMALIGGFLAPLVAGFDAAGIAPLLVYLALFIAALFALAGHRRWPWLAIAATAAGFGWTGFLIAAVDRGDVGAVGGFVILLAVAATLALPGDLDARNRRFGWLRLAPLTLGFLQLLALAPVLDFGALAWSFYLTIAAAALLLAHRDPRLLPAAPVALALFLLLLALAFPDGPTRASIAAAPIGAAIFAVPALLLSRQHRLWAEVAALGAAGPFLVAMVGRTSLLPPALWLLAAIPVVAALAFLAWRHRDRAGQHDAGLVAGVGFAALVAILAIGHALPAGSVALPAATAMAAMLVAARRSGPLSRTALLPLVVATVAALAPLTDLAAAALESVAGDPLPFAAIDDPALLVALLAPTALVGIAALLRDRTAFGAWRLQAIWLDSGTAIACAYILIKLPLRLTTPEAFAAWGFAERAVVTHAFLGAGWWLERRGYRTGRILTGIGLARIVWFDLLILDPALVRQAVGPIPLFNLAVLHPLAAAGWFVTRKEAAARRIAMALTLVATAAFVRQAAHGSFLTGPVTLGENWGYSAAFLLLAILWLWRGIARGVADWRRGGLALLVVVTLKVTVIDAARLDGVLRILSFLGLGLALIGIHWLYNRFLRPLSASNPSP